MLLAPGNYDFRIPVSDGEMKGKLSLPVDPKGLIIFVHGDGSSLESPRNRSVADELNRAGYGTFLFNLLTEREMQQEARLGVTFLAERLTKVTDMMGDEEDLVGLPIGYFGSSSGAAVALVASVYRDDIFALVSRGGRPDYAMDYLEEVNCPVLLIVGGLDVDIVDINRRLKKLIPNCDLRIVPNGNHLFSDSDSLSYVAEISLNWFDQMLPSRIPLRNDRTDLSSQEGLERR